MPPLIFSLAALGISAMGALMIVRPQWFIRYRQAVDKVTFDAQFVAGKNTYTIMRIRGAVVMVGAMVAMIVTLNMP